MNSKVRRFNHLFFNYGKIRSLLPPSLAPLSSNYEEQQRSSNATIYITRKENLRHDWKTINSILSGEPVSAIKNEISIPSREANDARNVSGLTMPVTRSLSEMGRLRLCQALEQEYKHYIWFLEAASNLDEQDIQEALAYSRQNCPNLDLLQNYYR
jgi:hypothetical protein